MRLVYDSDLYSGIDFMKFIIQSLMSFCIEVISPAPTQKNKRSIGAFDDGEWSVSMKNLEIVCILYRHTERVCVLCLYVCFESFFFLFLSKLCHPLYLI